MTRLQEDWSIVDEGPMSDLLGIDCDRMPDGSILLHQGRYIRKLLSRFAPNGPEHPHGHELASELGPERKVETSVASHRITTCNMQHAASNMRQATSNT